MKKYINGYIAKLYFLFTLITFVCLRTTSLGAPVFDDAPQVYLEPGIYLVVGVFNLEKNAHDYVNYMKRRGRVFTQKAFYPPNKMHYVFLGRYSSMEKAVTTAHRIRKESGLGKSWVFTADPYSLERIPQPMILTSTADEEDELVVEDKFSKPIPDSDPDITESTYKLEKEETLVEVEDSDPSNLKIYLNSFAAFSFEEVSGNVEIIDNDRLKRYNISKTHELLKIPKNINMSGNVQLSCNIFGYKKIQYNFNLSDPINPDTQAFLEYSGDTLLVNFALQRYSTGDIATMYNVYFFKDAAIMRPESKYEVNQLLEMLNENPKTRIAIHGHANGNAAGPIIRMQEGSTNYFSKSSANDKGQGSSRRLSASRALVIKDYLVNQGIAADRMEIRGWGGKKMIYDKHDRLAYKNVRVEIEILAD